MLRVKLFILLLTCGVFLAATHQTRAAGYQLSMLPRYSTEEIYKRITPLVDYLKNKTGLDISPTMTSTFDQYTKALISGKVAIGFENPYIYVLASKAHEAVAMAVKGKNGDKFRGIIVTRKDSPLHSLTDLKGKKISIVSYTSAGGYLSQKLSLLDKGIDITKECQLEEAPENKQENVVFSVFTGDVDAGFIRESALHKVDQFVPAGSIRVLAYTAWLPNWALSVKRGMAAADKKKIVRAIQEIPDNSPVLRALRLKKFRPAQDSDYDVIRRAAGLPLASSLPEPSS